MDTTILRKAGLTDSQAKGYLALIEHGALSPADLAQKIGENRTNGYAITERLVELDLAIKNEGAKAVFSPQSPAKLKQLLINRQRELKTTDNELSGIIPQLLSTYRLTMDRPGVVYLEGTDSLQQLYDDIIKTGDILRIFPSAYDRRDPDIADMIDQQIRRQRAANIKTETLLRKEVYPEFRPLNDALFEARPSVLGELDSQIMIYGDNVAITTYRTGVVTTIITSQETAETFRKIFGVLWHQANDPHTATDT